MANYSRRGKSEHRVHGFVSNDWLQCNA